MSVRGELIARELSPKNWGRLGSATYGRSELAADYYDEILFHGATFGDLAKQRDALLALVTGTDLSTGARFEFSQEQFDQMCSDLSPVRLARAAATSSMAASPTTSACAACSRPSRNWRRARTSSSRSASTSCGTWS
ncbi:MAG: hypothetical protein ABI781_15920 [Burkholderiales bacterium]